MQYQPDSQEIRADAIKPEVTRTPCFPPVQPSMNRRLNPQNATKIVDTNTIISAARNFTSRATRLLTRDAQMTSLLAENAQAIPTWWGTDSNTQSCCGMPQDSYIGRLGYGGEPRGDAQFFNTTAATNAGPNHTYGYWGVVGPDIRPSGTSPYLWGELQADNAWNAHENGTHASFVKGLTVFGDVEPGFGGWTFGNTSPNRDVLNGFLDRLFAITPPGVWPGLYITTYYWTNFFGQSFYPTTDFVLWLADSDACGSDICSPCNFSCNTLITVRNRLLSTIGNVTLGGRKTVLWQYWISDCGCGDFNVLTQNTSSLLPIRGMMTYYSPR